MKNKKKIILCVIVVGILGALVFYFVDTAGDDWESGPLNIISGEQYPLELVQGNKEDLQTFSVWPNTQVFMDNIPPDSLVSYPDFIQGIVSDSYFSKGKVTVNILSEDKQLLRAGYAESMKIKGQPGFTEFLGSLDYMGLPLGPIFIEIKSRGIENRSILIPVINNNPCKVKIEKNYCKT